MTKDVKSKYISLVILGIAFVALLYVTIKAIQIVDKTQIGTSDGIYTNRVTTSQEIYHKAHKLTESCENEFCQVQNLLDYVTHIPYKVNHFRAHSPQKTIQNNFGDCDDKSNLLISMLHALGKEAYFVLVPHHIFVITPIEDDALSSKKGLWLDEKKYYILESTAEGSVIGFPLHYTLDEISAIVEPFSNTKVVYTKLAYKQ
jgi:uncharacterized protein YoxC